MRVSLRGSRVGRSGICRRHRRRDVRVDMVEREKKSIEAVNGGVSRARTRASVCA
jgi:hypothetical protein